MNILEYFGLAFIIIILAAVVGLVIAKCVGCMSESPEEQAERDKEELLAAANKHVQERKKVRCIS